MYNNIIEIFKINTIESISKIQNENTRFSFYSESKKNVPAAARKTGVTPTQSLDAEDNS